jgi:hypothetical protein
MLVRRCEPDLGIERSQTLDGGGGADSACGSCAMIDRLCIQCSFVGLSELVWRSWISLGASRRLMQKKWLPAKTPRFEKPVGSVVDQLVWKALKGCPIGEGARILGIHNPNPFLDQKALS